ncbi:P-type ATPase [Streptoalloteichus hindustanus]|uniref:E1-E2 ATPase n=1 Tax=Streptoalloteichus hindustanus TaxID=2017 RepID=A0A1M5DTP8_STRHI|nr:hypothetical protein [Streptoalloteichus hindustanus]SHF70408.1 E1-E2 ATPase [Streptoalloteichus hindustanus]
MNAINAARRRTSGRRPVRRDRLGLAAAVVLGLPALGLAAVAGGAPLFAVAGLVLVGGLALGEAARRWAEQDLRRVWRAAPRWANQRMTRGVRTVPAARVGPGDLVVVRQGEMVPVDGRIAGVGLFDESALGAGTRPRWRSPGGAVLAGATNLGPDVELWATTGADDSAHAALRNAVVALRVAEEALVNALRRLGFGLGVAGLLAAAVVWALTGEPARAASVLLVATPLPLLTASVVAMTAGASRAARRGVLRDTANPLAGAVARRARRCAVGAGCLALVPGLAGVAAAFGHLAPMTALLVRAVVDATALGVALLALFPPLCPSLRGRARGSERHDGPGTSLNALLGLPG